MDMFFAWRLESRTKREVRKNVCWMFGSHMRAYIQVNNILLAPCETSSTLPSPPLSHNTHTDIVATGLSSEGFVFISIILHVPKYPRL